MPALQSAIVEKSKIITKRYHPVTTFWRKVVVRLGYFAAGIVILAALLVSMTRLLTPLLNDHRDRFEELATQTLNRPVQIGEVNILWDFYEPELVFRNVFVLDPTTRQPNIKIPLIRIDIAIWNSLISRSLILDSLKVTGVHLSLHEQNPGELSVEGFNQFFSVTDNFTGRTLNPNAILTWIFSQPKLVLQKFAIQYVSYQGVSKDITLKWLALTNTSNDHRLTGKAILNQESPTQASIRFNWKGNITDLPHVSADLSLNLDNISLAQWFARQTLHGINFKKGLGSAKISGTWNNNSWQKVETDVRFFDTAFTLNQVFANPLTFAQLSGLLTWQKDKDGTWLMTTENIQAITSDMNAKANLSMSFPVNDSPTINLTSDFSLSQAKNISNYLPLKIFEPELVDWLRHAFVGGQVVTAHAIVQGRLSDFPFDTAAGKFEIGGEVKDIELNYAPHWPSLQHINGKILFTANSMTVDIVSAKIKDVLLNTIHADIPTLGTNPVLTVKTIVKTDLDRGFNFIQASPLQKTIGKNLEALKLQGPMQLALNLIVPLNQPGDIKVTGDTSILNATLNLPDWNLAINQLSGAFQFTENSITASNMTGQLFAHPITLDLLTEHPKGKSGYVTAILQGAVNTTDLKSWLDLPIETILAGSTNYKAQLTLPPQDTSSQPVQITVQSDLKGIAVNLPAQYGKQVQDTADFELNLFAKENQPLKAHVNYNKLFSLAMMLQRVKQKFSLQSADLHLGSGDANWQSQSGIIITGNIDRIDWDTIVPYVSQFTDKNKATVSAQNNLINPDLFRALDIQTTVVNFSGFELKNMRVQLTRAGNNFVLGLTNADMQGQISIPRGGIQQGIQAKFQRLTLSSQLSSSGKQAAINPRTLPPISFVGDDVRYADMRLGRATLILVPNGSGLTVKQFNLVSPSYKLNAEGSWTSARSRLQGNVATTNITDLLKSWGFASSNLLGSTGDLNFDLNWAGGLFRPTISSLSGIFSVKLGQGRIINLGNDADAKMGLGRLLNIFSLQSLPRRLSLNFSDLSEKGYSFDSMKGDFILRNGNAVTQSTIFLGPIAGIEIAGRIGLAAKDLDIKINVTPHVTSSLPVVTAIATANPIVGVAAFVVDKIVSPAVSQMTTYDYAITGSWANPVWNQVGGKHAPTVAPVSGR